MNKIIVGMMAVLLLSVSVIWAQQINTPGSSQMSVAQPIDIGNKFCPVSGRQIGLMGPGVQETYNGKIYHLCCGGCISTFESNPEKYSKIAENEVHIPIKQ
jgi:YHS domain-containing protein